MRDRLFLVRCALGRRGGWCKQDFNWCFGWQRFAYADGVGQAIYRLTGWLIRVLYTAKVIVCVLLDRQEGLWARDGVEVAAWGMKPWQSWDFPGTAYDWDVLVVRPGLRGWRYDSFETSSA